MSELYNTLNKAFWERVPYVDIARNKRVQTSIDATVG